MPILPNSNAPYAPPSAILGVIDRARSRGLPNPVTKEVLSRAGVTDSLIPRTFQALQLLELINDDGTWTQNLEALRKAPEAGFQALLAEIIRALYADLFQYIDPMRDSVQEIRDGFRSYVPHGQQDRMVALFVGLCQRAGLAPEGTGTSREPRVQRRPLTAKTKGPKSKPTDPPPPPPPPPGANLPNGVPAPLAVLLGTLPENGWTQVERDRFVTAFNAMLDYCVPVRKGETP